MTARELANILSADRTEINTLLYGALQRLVIQDAKYRWYPADSTPTPAAATQQLLNTPLARLCRYYLACLGHDDEAGVSVFAKNKYGEPDYHELETFPSNESGSLFQSEGARRVIAMLRKDKYRLGMYFGYPTLLRKQTSRGGWEGYFVEPLVLYSVDASDNSNSPSLSKGFPIINLRALRRLTGCDREGLMEELVQLEEELGLTSENELPEPDELVQRLTHIRSEWQWVEPCNPLALGAKPSLPDLSVEGIYNRAVLVVAERSRYTQGLESELKSLSTLAESAYGDTVLGQWLANSIPKWNREQVEKIVEVMPLNSEQRQAVQGAIGTPLTVITGPPGTGKSQVVSDILINSAWLGKRVLFASKNNKAVDVVEVRINNLGPRPILLRVGSNQYQTKLAEYLLGLLSSKASEDDNRDYEEALAIQRELEAKDATLAKMEQELIALRNRVDEIEQTVEALRAELSPDVFAASRFLNIGEIERTSDAFTSAVRSADKKSQPLLTQIVWFLVAKQRYEAVIRLIETCRAVARQLKISLPTSSPNGESIHEWKAFAATLNQKVDHVRRARAYFDDLAALQLAKPLPEIAMERVGILRSMAANAGHLWNKWLQLQPAKLKPNDRQLINKYSALLKMVIDAGSEGRLGAGAYREYNSLFAKVAHLLPCWAVTSLSAKGRIPFEPGFFDLVVFDEASQCDIASALPLLFRAKRAAVIGDPKQLAHISGLPRGQDQKILEKFGLIGTHPHWAYSYNSLFDLAAGLASGDDLINLRDHHRSHAEIIEFSNKFFYEGRLRTATRYTLLNRPQSEKAGVRWVNVAGRVIRPGSSALNREEASAVVRELRKLVIDRGYTGSIGVVSPFRAQANLIRELVLSDPALAERLVKQDFLSDTVHKFQGDERDLMIFSPVLSEGMPRGAIGFLRSNGNLFNVAITRARAMLIVVGDLAASAQCEIEYLAEFAQYTQSLLAEGLKEMALSDRDLGSEYPVVANPEQVSDWEKILYRALYGKGIFTIPQYQVERYILDFAAVDGARRLNIEVDGERYHRAWNGELCRRDQMRNQRLYELDWDVLRFWVYEIRDDLEGCIRKVKKWKANEPSSIAVPLTISSSRSAASGSTARHPPSQSAR